MTGGLALWVPAGVAIGLAVAIALLGYAPFQAALDASTDAVVKGSGLFPPIVADGAAAGRSADDQAPAAAHGGATRECDPRLVSSLPADHVSRDFPAVPADWVLSSSEAFDAYLESERLPHPVLIRGQTRCSDTYLMRPVFVGDGNNDLDELLLSQKAATATGSYPQIR